jgi:hypothetical protein
VRIFLAVIAFSVRFGVTAIATVHIIPVLEFIHDFLEYGECQFGWFLLQFQPFCIILHHFQLGLNQLATGVAHWIDLVEFGHFPVTKHICQRKAEKRRNVYIYFCVKLMKMIHHFMTTYPVFSLYYTLVVIESDPRRNFFRIRKISSQSLGKTSSRSTHFSHIFGILSWVET